MLADVFENFRNMCIKVYELDPAHFLSAPGLAWQGSLKKICHAIYRYAKANNKYKKNYNKYKEESFF